MDVNVKRYCALHRPAYHRKLDRKKTQMTLIITRTAEEFVEVQKPARDLDLDLAQLRFGNCLPYFLDVWGLY